MNRTFKETDDFSLNNFPTFAERKLDWILF